MYFRFEFTQCTTHVELGQSVFQAATSAAWSGGALSCLITSGISGGLLWGVTTFCSSLIDITSSPGCWALQTEANKPSSEREFSSAKAFSSALNRLMSSTGVLVIPLIIVFNSFTLLFSFPMRKIVVFLRRICRNTSMTTNYRELISCRSESSKYKL